nr:excinuclease ABC subunit UvrC [Candidatus Njordarchaeum guaymaensis]
MDVEKVIEGIPESPGVYVMKDTQGHVIYIGKANNIRKRVLSHFRHSENEKDLTLSSITSSIEFITTPTEVEALLLENNLIKKHKPRYNIRLRDDKTYPFLMLSMKEKFPFISIVRRIVDDGSTYFGPMGNVGGARATLKIIRRIFPIRNCDRSISEDKKKQKPCLEYQLKQCSAPCAGLIDEEEYKALVEGARRILSGEQDKLTDEFKRRMVEASEKLDFEKAAFYRDRIRDIERTTLKQVMVFPQKISKDILAVAKKGDDACIQLLMIRGGKLIDQAHYFLEGVGGSSDEQILSEFTNQHYHYGAPSSIPPEIMVQKELEDKELLQRSLTEKRKSSPEGASTTAVKIMSPVSEEDSKLVQMANRNAEAYLEQSLSQEERRKIRAEQALAELKTILKLPKSPSRIEAFDVSTAGGEAAVGSAVALINGEPAKFMYRRFRIKTVRGQDDFAMMKEIVKRRYRRLTQEKEKEPTPLPDLVLIDGGKGQLNAALEAQSELGIRIPTIGLAKEFDDVYVPHQPEPINMPKDSKAMLLLKRARDEAHRFAVSYHRKKMRKKILESILDTVPGIGPKRKGILMQYFDSIEDICTADDERISVILKLNREKARKLREQIADLVKGK